MELGQGVDITSYTEEVRNACVERRGWGGIRRPQTIVVSEYNNPVVFHSVRKMLYAFLGSISFNFVSHFLILKLFLKINIFIAVHCYETTNL